jgi:hypothetical protein
MNYYTKTKWSHDPMYLWVLLVEEIGVHVDNHRSSSSHRQTLSHKVWNIVESAVNHHNPNPEIL